MFYAIIAIVAVAAIVGIVFVFKRNSAIKKNGIEADAVVSRIKEEEIERENGFYDVNYVYYVKYQTQDGNTVEAKLNSAPALTREGDRFRIKYLPEKPKYVLLVD